MLTAAVPSRAIRLLRETGLLATTLPELHALAEADVSGDGPWERSLVTLDAASRARPGDEGLALAALLFETGTATARHVLGRLRLSGRDSAAICELIEAAALEYESSWSDPDLRRYMSRVPPDLLDALLALRRARTAGDDEAGARESELRARITAQRVAHVPLALADLAVDGRDLRETLGLPEGPVIGKILERLMTDVIEDPSLNSRMTLLTRASLHLDALLQRGDGEA